MMTPIRLSALGRDVRVGDSYNYSTGAIAHSRTEVPERSKRIERKSRPKIKMYFFFQQPDKFKCSLLGVNSHLQQNIEGGSVIDLNKLWFAGYLKTSPITADGDANVAQVTFFFRVSRRIETLDKNFKPKPELMNVNQLYLVEQVVYGAEFICSMQKTINYNRETKESVEESIYLAAQAYFNKAAESNWNTSVELPTELDDVSFIILSSLEAGKQSKGSMQQFCEKLGSANSCDVKEKLRPVKIYLRSICEQTQNQLSPEMKIQVQFEKERIDSMWRWINDESHILSSQPPLDRVPPFKTAMNEFLILLASLRQAIDKCYETTKANELIKSKSKRIVSLLADVIDWLIHRRQEIEDVIYLINAGTGIRMDMFDLEEIKNRDASISEKSAKVFILKVDYKRDSLMESIQKTSGHSKPEFKFPAFPSTGEKLLKSTTRLLQAFANSSRSVDEKLCIGLVPVSSSLDDCATEYVKYRASKEFEDSLLIMPTSPDFIQEPVSWLSIDTPPRTSSPLPPPPPEFDLFPSPHDDSPSEINDFPTRCKDDSSEFSDLPPSTPPYNLPAVRPKLSKKSTNKRTNKASNLPVVNKPVSEEQWDLFLSEIRKGPAMLEKNRKPHGRYDTLPRAPKSPGLEDVLKSALHSRNLAIDPPDSDTISEAGSKVSDWDEK